MSDMNHPNPNQWWFHRRLAMYISLSSCIAQTVMFTTLAYYHPEALLSLGAVIGFSYGFFTMVCMAYFGNTIVDDYMKNKEKK